MNMARHLLPDFKGRGGKATEYSRFIIDEFIPFLKGEFKVSLSVKIGCIAECRSAAYLPLILPIPMQNNSEKSECFSGSFWWRKKAYVKKDLEDRSRIILEVIKNGAFAPHLKFWLQCGTEDETADRNNNGIIDAIDDTLDVIKELQLKGYSYPGDITYVQVEGGKHDLPTWGAQFPNFVRWAFGK